MSEIETKIIEPRVRTEEEWVEMIVGKDIEPIMKGTCFRGRDENYPI